MTTRDEMIELAKVVSKKRQRVENLGMVNVANQTPEQRVDLDARYKLANDEWMMAERAYAEALGAYRPEAGAGASQNNP